MAGVLKCAQANGAPVSGAPQLFLYLSTLGLHLLMSAFLVSSELVELVVKIPVLFVQQSGIAKEFIRVMPGFCISKAHYVELMMALHAVHQKMFKSRFILYD